MGGYVLILLYCSSGKEAVVLATWNWEFVLFKFLPSTIFICYMLEQTVNVKNRLITCETIIRCQTENEMVLAGTLEFFFSKEMLYIIGRYQVT